ncbi:MAG: hypothetical protein WKF43_00200 [Acidimicrobiales bacterium]
MIVGFLVVAVAAPIAGRVAVRLGVVDEPGPLKVHDRPVPYLGGLALLAGLVGPVAVGTPALLIPLGLAALLGLVDDVVPLSPRLRLACEALVGVAAAAVVPGRGLLGAAVTIVVVIVLLNAVNLLDGLDGLASGVGAVSALGFALALQGQPRLLALALAGGLIGFLLWNRPPAHIYLGDAGSYLVGTALALLLARSFGPGQPVALASGAVLFVAVPVADTAVALVRRHRAGRPLLLGDRGHVYDQLNDRGWGPLAATGACIGAQAVLVVIGLGVNELPGPAAAAVVVALVVAVGAALLWTFTSPASWA